jgi:transposase
MSLRPKDFSVVPEETARVAQAAFPKGNAYLTLRNEFGAIYEDELFVPLFKSIRGRPAESPGCLALVTALQFAENLSDRQAANAVRGRIDWKYLLGLELSDPGFDYTLLHEFRIRLLENGAERKLLDALLELLKTRKLLKARGKQRTDSTHVLAAVRDLNRLEMVSETLRHALEILAVVTPDWLKGFVAPEWFDRYGKRFEQWRLPKSHAEQRALAETIGQDGRQLLAMIEESASMTWLQRIPSIETLHQVWQQQYDLEQERPRWREGRELPPASQLIISPYDVEARFSIKRSTKWSGYKVHLTETCADDLPSLITNVETTASTTTDVEMTDPIHQHLAENALLPEEHLVDAGYVDARILAEGQSQYGLDVIGPAPGDHSWQARTEKAYSLSCFEINWDAQRVICPQGHACADWQCSQDPHDEPVIHVRFRRQDCLHCSARGRCTRARTGARTLTFRPKEQHLALQQARQRQSTADFKEAYSRRAGIEGTISQGTRRCGLRRSRYIGLAKTHLQHIFTAVAINLVRLAAWFEEVPRAQTRCTRFAALVSA